MATGVDVEVAGPTGPVGTIDWGGSGDPILFLHGGGTNAAEWSLVVPYLVGEFRCVGLDMVGHGKTSVPAELSFEVLLDNIDAVIDHLAVSRDRLTLVGHSYGGALAACHQSARPGCRAVVGVDSAPRIADLGEWPPPNRSVPTPEQLRADGWGWAGDAAALQARVAARVAGGEPEQCARRSHLRTADGTYREVPTPEFLMAFSGLGLRPDNPLIGDRPYRSIRCPTLLVCATQGNAADNREYVDALPRHLPSVSVTWVEGPHALNWAQPEVVALRIRKFLAS
jgi:pimeloyl-ACP methyl ester carboxylesterase